MGPNSRQRRTDLQDVTRRLGAFALEPRRHKTLPYAASPDYVKLGQIYKTLPDIWAHLLWSQNVTRRFHTQPPSITRVGGGLISMLQVTYKLNGSGAKCTSGAPNARGGRRMHFWGAECTRGAPNAPRGRRTHRQGAKCTGGAPNAHGGRRMHFWGAECT